MSDRPRPSAGKVPPGVCAYQRPQHHEGLPEVAAAHTSARSACTQSTHWASHSSLDTRQAVRALCSRRLMWQAPRPQVQPPREAPVPRSPRGVGSWVPSRLPLSQLSSTRAPWDLLLSSPSSLSCQHGHHRYHHHIMTSSVTAIATAATISGSSD